MKSQILDGKKLSVQLREQIKLDSIAFNQQHNRKVGLAVVVAGDDPATAIYVRNKITACNECNVESFSHCFDNNVSQNELIELIQSLNENPLVDGILVQLPLPKGIDEKKVLDAVSPNKDVDGFHSVNAGNLLLNKECLAACTPSGIIELIKSSGQSIEGKHAVIVGRSNIVGKPVAILLLNNNATVTICHSHTPDLAFYTRQADILVAAVGRKEFISGDMIKDNAIVIDVGINRVDGKLYGDVDFDKCSEKASFITPVPGGVGPMTITMLLKNTIKAARLMHG